ncbi:MAG: MFS transporter [Chloroflexota bacterium]
MDRRSRPAFAGRRILLVAGLAVFAAGAGQTYGFSPFVEPMLADLGFSRSLFSALYAVATLLCAASLLPAGRLVDRLGSRVLLAATALALAIALWLNSRAAGALSALVGISLLRATGAGILPLASRTLVPFWFVRERGRAFSILGLAGTFSVALIPVWHQAMIGAVGWRAAWLADAAIMLLLAPCIWLAVRDRPEDLGQLPDGDAPLDEHASRAAAASDTGYTLADAARTPAFWATGLAYLAPSMILTGLAFNQVALLGERGIPASFGALTFAIEAAVCLPVTLATGWFVDRRPFRWSLALAQGLIALAILVLLIWHSRLGASLYAALRGASVGLWLVSVDVAWPTWFGRRHVGAIRGAGTALSLAGAALGPLPFGVARDVTGSYDPALAALLIVPVLAAAWMLVVRPPAPPLEAPP